MIFLKTKKNNIHWEKILGYNANDLIKRLTSLFKEGMNLNNYGRGGWHIDHIIPLKFKNPDGSYYFNQIELSDINSETFKKAWGLLNLQPLWESENCSKCNKYIG